MLTPTHPFQLTLGFIIWSLWFAATYGGMSIACSLAAPDPSLGPKTWINGVLLAATLLITAFLLLLGARCGRAAAKGQKGFVPGVAACLYCVAALSTLAVGLPSVALPPCL